MVGRTYATAIFQWLANAQLSGAGGAQSGAGPSEPQLDRPARRVSAGRDQAGAAERLPKRLPALPGCPGDAARPGDELGGRGGYCSSAAAPAQSAEAGSWETGVRFKTSSGTPSFAADSQGYADDIDLCPSEDCDQICDTSDFECDQLRTSDDCQYNQEGFPCNCEQDESCEELYEAAVVACEASLCPEPRPVVCLGGGSDPRYRYRVAVREVSRTRSHGGRCGVWDRRRRDA